MYIHTDSAVQLYRQEEAPFIFVAFPLYSVVKVLSVDIRGGGKSFDLPTPAQLKRARRGKAWNRGYSICTTRRLASLAIN